VTKKNRLKRLYDKPEKDERTPLTSLSKELQNQVVSFYETVRKYEQLCYEGNWIRAAKVERSVLRQYNRIKEQHNINPYSVRPY